MRTIVRTVIGLAVFLSPLLTTVVLAQKTSYDIRRDWTFAGTQTYAFKEAPSLSTNENTTTYDSPLIDQRMKAAIASELENRGLRRDDAHPDVYVVARRSYRTEVSYYSSPSYGWPSAGWGWGWNGGWGPYYAGFGGWGAGSVYQEESVVGRLTIDMEKASTGELMWRGVGEKHVHEHSSPSRRDKRMNEQIADIFDHFPSARAIVRDEASR